MKKTLTFLASALLLSCVVQAQTKIGLPAGAANASSILDISNTGGGNKGFLAPQVVLTGTATAAPITSPANGLIVFNTTAGGSGATAVVVGYYYWNTTLTQWVSFSTSASALTTGNIYTNDGTLTEPRTVTGSGLNKLNFNTKVGIGTTTPASALEIPFSTLIASLTTDSGYIMLGQPTAVHTIFDFGNIQTKTNATTAGNLGLNPFGGSITLGAAATRTSLEVSGVVKLDSLASAASTDSIVTVNAASGILHKRTISDLINNSGVATNIYNGNGTLSSARTVTQAGNVLAFTGGNITFNPTGITSNLLIDNGNNGRNPRLQTNDTLEFQTASNTYQLNLLPSGNVGIGTNSPSVMLDVAGAARIRTIATATGATVNNALVVDANGNILKTSGASNSAANVALIPQATGTLVSNLSTVNVANTATKLYNLQISGQDGCGLSFSTNFLINNGGTFNNGGVAFLGGGTSQLALFTGAQITVSTVSADHLRYTVSGPASGCGDGSNANITTFILDFVWAGSGAARAVTVTLTNGATTGTNQRNWWCNTTQIF